MRTTAITWSPGDVTPYPENEPESSPIVERGPLSVWAERYNGTTTYRGIAETNIFSMGRADLVALAHAVLDLVEAVDADTSVRPVAAILPAPRGGDL